jgi:16S rRNA (guanine527-N7)-methyltransferase
MDESQQDLLISGASIMQVALDAAAMERFSIYLALLQLWGRKISITTRLEATEVIVHHFLDSLAGVPFLADSPTARVVDLGAGAGLPSLPLKFILPGLRVLLVESVRKKVAFCQQVIRATGISGITAVWGRGEDLGTRPAHHRAYDWAVSRALGSSAEVARLAHPFLAPGGRILLYKGAPDSGELRQLDAFCADYRGSWELRQVAIPHLKAARSLVIVTFP